MILVLHGIVLSDKYNDYLEVNGRTIRGTACNKAAKPIYLQCISANTPLIKFVSLEDADENDGLYIVLVDIVSILIITANNSVYCLT